MFLFAVLRHPVSSVSRLAFVAQQLHAQRYHPAQHARPPAAKPASRQRHAPRCRPAQHARPPTAQGALSNYNLAQWARLSNRREVLFTVNTKAYQKTKEAMPSGRGSPTGGRCNSRYNQKCTHSYAGCCLYTELRECRDS